MLFSLSIIKISRVDADMAIFHPLAVAHCRCPISSSFFINSAFSGRVYPHVEPRSRLLWLSYAVPVFCYRSSVIHEEARGTPPILSLSSSSSSIFLSFHLYCIHYGQIPPLYSC
eukprot:TRINITY_DN6269_c0_g1_i3.p2 TRINITY_DN6269_c0_g1~~TRINITY_DN6269_c0_g1_i3.p2  ORF type:complete len:114 (-),score=12.90 TRINITY_DN6269_c0_g1_i3:527-868(-)